MEKTITLIIWIVVFLCVGYLMGHISQESIDGWYAMLPKAPLTPPNWVFPLVWTILYIMIAIAGWAMFCVYSSEKLMWAKVFYFIQVLLNWSWTPVFFYFHQIGHALVILIGILITTLITILLTYRKAKLTAYLLMPYFLWLCFAGYLNGYLAF